MGMMSGPALQSITRSTTGSLKQRLFYSEAWLLASQKHVHIAPPSASTLPGTTWLGTCGMLRRKGPMWSRQSRSWPALCGTSQKLLCVSIESENNTCPGAADWGSTMHLDCRAELSVDGKLKKDFEDYTANLFTLVISVGSTQWTPVFWAALDILCNEMHRAPSISQSFVQTLMSRLTPWRRLWYFSKMAQQVRLATLYSCCAMLMQARLMLTHYMSQQNGCLYSQLLVFIITCAKACQMLFSLYMSCIMHAAMHAYCCITVPSV